MVKYIIYASVAQLVEQFIRNEQVDGSNPPRSSNERFPFVEYPGGRKPEDVWCLSFVVDGDFYRVIVRRVLYAE